jgi:carbon-monoxide dehydrogenase small subunit
MAGVTLQLNGESRTLEVDPRRTLLDALRIDCGLTGSKKSCDMGNCGACTVLLDGKTVKSCCVLAADTDGQEITTIEALSSSPRDLHPIQVAFVENQGLQCGFCTPGIVISALQLLQENPDPTEVEVRHAIAGNLCRCTGYQLIVKSVLDAARRMRSESPVAA